MKSITYWITPFTNRTSLEDAVSAAHQRTDQLGNGWVASLLLPTHFGKWPQAQCRQTLPHDLVVGGPDDVAAIRASIEDRGLGFGCWGVPVDRSSAELAAGFAAAGGYYVANFEPGEFWTEGDSPEAIDAWWSAYWNALPDQDALSGNTGATIVPNGWGLGAFSRSMPNLADGCGSLFLEVYGGLQTSASYPSPNLWPRDGFARVRATGANANLYPILADANLSDQIALANRLGHGNVHDWAL